MENKMTKPEKPKETTGEMVRSFLFAILIALVFRSLAYEPFHIPSGSMLSTLYEGDYIFVSKLSYGYSRFSFPFGLPVFNDRILETAPERGDVVVFRNTENTHVDYIKRLIGLPGDRIQVKKGRLYINDKAVEVVRDGDVSVPDAEGEMHTIARYQETLPNGKKHIILDDLQNGPADNTPVYTVPDGHYFMMGDNRDNSLDSRYAHQAGFLDPGRNLGVGFVPAENLVGRADVILLSFDVSKPIWKFWQWPNSFRNDRWLKSI